MPEEPNTIAPQTPDEPSSGGSIEPLAPPASRSSRRWWIVAGIAVLLISAIGMTWWLASRNDTKEQGSANTQQSADKEGVTEEEVSVSSTEGLQLDAAKNYGDKYANGLLPVGDSKYVTDSAKKGSVYMCNANFVPASQAGAQTRGPWFTTNNTQWDINKKATIAGQVNWDQNITIKIENGKRVVTTNDLPDHHTGVFPVASSDPAKQYDANPNTIKSQSLVYSLAASPTYGKPQCMGGEVGVMLTGVALFNAFDAGGRDAGAWEVQDSCDGHPQSAGEYHYHTLSRCIKDVSVSTVVGYALDGFPITGPKVGDKNYLTTDDLDECHGIVSEVTLDGKKVTTYHYIMTQDFPYSASCFRASAIKPPGQQEGQGSSAQAQPTQQGASQQPPPGQQPPPYGPKP